MRSGASTNIGPPSSNSTVVFDAGTEEPVVVGGRVGEIVVDEEAVERQRFPLDETRATRRYLGLSYSNLRFRVSVGGLTFVRWVEWTS